MARLDKDGPATTAELARAEGMKPQSMGTTIAALEEMGIVERRPHPTDGRQMNIELTAKGAALRKSARDAKRTWLAQAIAQLDEEDRETLFKAGEIITRRSWTTPLIRRSDSQGTRATTVGPAMNLDLPSGNLFCCSLLIEATLYGSDCIYWDCSPGVCRF